MRFTTQIGKATDKGASRYGLSNVLVTPQNDAVATDGQILAVSRFDGELAEPAYVADAPATATDLNANYATAWTDAGWATTKRRKNKTDTISSQNGRFPRCNDVLPEVPTDYVQFGIDTELLRNLALSINSNGGKVLQLFVDTSKRHNQRAILAVSGDNIGVIMPTTCDTTAAETYETRRKGLEYLNESIKTVNERIMTAVDSSN